MRDLPTPIGLVLTSFDPGGTERQMTELIRRLDPHRFEVHVACFRRSGLWRPIVEQAAASVTEFPVTGFRSPSTAIQLLRFARWCRSRRLQAVHACDFYANVFALTGAALARVPVRIGSRRDIRIPLRSGGQHRLQEISYRFAHRVVANAAAAAEQLEREGVPRSSIVVIPNGIDLARYEPAVPRPVRRVVTTVANLRGEKGHDVLVRAAAIVRDRVPGVIFQLVGDGPMHETLATDVQSLNLGTVVRFLGHREDVPALLRESDAFVLPSRTEAFPNGLLEAMAAGLPAVATRVGGIPELVDDGRNGLLVPAGDHEALAAAVIRVLTDDGVATRLAHEARRTVEARYAFERMVTAFETLYADTIAAAMPRTSTRARVGNGVANPSSSVGAVE